MSSKPIKAVIFDIGGVVVGSPLFAINEYEKQLNLPLEYLNVAITAQGSQGSFQKFERNEIDLYTFYREFGQELSNVNLNNRYYETFCQTRGEQVPRLPNQLKIDGRELFGFMMRNTLKVNPKMDFAIQKLRESKKFQLAALTNNFTTPKIKDETMSTRSLEDELNHLGLSSSSSSSSSEYIKSLFDYYIESAKVGMRKPDINFYKYALDLLQVNPEETVFLDDIGLNLKAAQKLGIRTIRVNSKDPTQALEKLSQITGLNLFKDPSSKL